MIDARSEAMDKQEWLSRTAYAVFKFDPVGPQGFREGELRGSRDRQQCQAQ